MKRELYKTDYSSYKSNKIYEGNKFRFVVSKVTPRVISLKEALLWNIACLGRCKAYCLLEGNKVVHRSIVVRGRTKFTFLEKGDIEIGPCWTDEKYRGKGLYPFVLSEIIRSELRGGGTAYMIVNDQNTPSLNGIHKVGFVKAGKIVVKDALKRQIAIDDVENGKVIEG